MSTKQVLKRIFLLLLASLLVFCVLPEAAASANSVFCTHHTHDQVCGGLQNNCTYVCYPCITHVQALIDALPNLQEIDSSNRDAVIAQMEAIDAAKVHLSDASSAKVNYTKYSNAAFVLSAPEGWFGLALEKLAVAPVGTELSVPAFTFLDEHGQPASIYVDGAMATSVELFPNEGIRYIYLPAGSYTVEESVQGSWDLSMKVNGKVDADLTFSANSGEAMYVAFSNTYNAVYSTFSNDNSQVYSGNDLSAALSAGGSGSIVYMHQDDFISSSVTIPSGVRLDMSSGATLTLSSSAELHVNGSITSASVSYPANYFWRDSNGNKISASSTISSASLTYGIRLDKDGAIVQFENSTNGTLTESYSVNWWGKERTPGIVVSVNGKTLTKGTDYSAVYSNNVLPGTATVTITGKGLYSGALKKNFIITKASVLINSGATQYKVYDGTTNVDPLSIHWSVSVISGTDVTVNTDNIKLTLTNPNVQSSHSTNNVRVSGVKLSGSDAKYYTISNVLNGGGIKVTSKPLTLESITFSKAYDGTNTAIVTSYKLSGFVDASHEAKFSLKDVKATYKDASVGTKKPVTVESFTLACTDETIALNYSLTMPQNLTGTITAKPITVTNIKIEPTKVYDGTTDVKITSYGTLNGVVKGEKVTLNTKNVKAKYNDEKVGNNKEVTFSGYTISGANAKNYKLVQPTKMKASITSVIPKNDSTDAASKITPETVTPNDKTVLEEVKAQLEKELQENDEYNQEQKDLLQKEIDRIDSLLDQIEKIEDLENKVNTLPTLVPSEDGAPGESTPESLKQRIEALEEIKKIYESLTEHEKTMLTPAFKAQYDAAMAELPTLEAQLAQQVAAQRASFFASYWWLLLLLAVLIVAAIIIFIIIKRRKDQ